MPTFLNVIRLQLTLTELLHPVKHMIYVYVIRFKINSSFKTNTYVGIYSEYICKYHTEITNSD